MAVELQLKIRVTMQRRENMTAPSLVSMYQCTTMTRSRPAASMGVNDRSSAMKNADKEIERVQTGVRLEKRLLKVLKGLAEYLDLSLGDLLEGMALHALENKPPFS